VARRGIKSTLCSLSSDSGFTLLELLVSSLLGLVVAAMIMASLLSHRDLYKKDIVRTRLNQNLRGPMDIIGTDIRLAGENLGSGFPAILVENGAGGEADALVLRRNLVAEVAPVCVALTQGSTTGLTFATSGTTAGCIYSTQTTTYNSWRNYRIAQGGSVPAFIWNSAARVGEFFYYNGEINAGGTYSLTRVGSWQHAYPVTTSAAYLLEEWRFEVAGDTLQLIRNQDNSDPVNVSFEISGFQIAVNMQDGTAKTSFAATDTWTAIQNVAVTLSTTASFAGNDVSRTLTSNFFPRNVLSN
jgi:prepilin-type N-terminal cleavage/methylation domain-containing protein